MEENAPWKAVFIGVFFSLIILGLTYLFIAPRDSEFFVAGKTEKVTEFTNTRVSGHKEGKMAWELFAEEGWTNKRHEINFLNRVSKGKIYRDGKPIIKALIAPRAMAHRRSEIVEAFGLPEGQEKGESKLKAYINLERISNRDKEEWSRIITNYLKYFPKEETSELKGQVKLFQKDSTIFADRILVEHKNNVAHISDNVILQRKDETVYADKMDFFSNNDKLEADHEVTIVIKEGKVKTIIKCDHASFFEDINKDMHIKGNIKAVQGKKIAIGDKGVYSQKDKDLYLKGNVKAIFEKAQAILKEKTVKKLDNPDTMEVLKEKTILTSDELEFSTKTGDARASGNVFVYQKGKESKADNALYDDKTEIITLTGNALIKDKEDKEWISAKKVIISIVDETFEAFGKVEAQLTL